MRTVDELERTWRGDLNGAICRHCCFLPMKFLASHHHLATATLATNYALAHAEVGTGFIGRDLESANELNDLVHSSGSGTNVNALVPEPATLVMLMFAAAGWCLRRSRAA
jgi:hypothetical protein